MPPCATVGVAGPAGAQDPAAVVRLATLLIQRGFERLLAMELRASAFLDLGRLDDALADCRQAAPLLGSGEPQRRAAWAIIACRAHSLKGDVDEAVDCLGDAYARDVSLAQGATRYPEVRRLLNAPGYP